MKQGAPPIRPPRYSERPFPAYAYQPGLTPHPRRDPAGHSHGHPEPAIAPFRPEAWDHAGTYLYGVDLYNHGYFWESHEIFEGLWNAFGHETTAGRLFKGLVQLAAANLKRAEGFETASRALGERGLAGVAGAPEGAFGLPVARLVEETRAWFARRSDRFPVIALAMPFPGEPPPPPAR